MPEQGGKRRTWKLPTPGFTPGELTFTAHAAGFYALELPRGGTRQQLLKSSVPVGIDVRESDRTLAGVKGAPVSLWFDVPDGRAFTCGAFGSDYYRFKASLVNPSGETVASKDVVSDSFGSTCRTGRDMLLLVRHCGGLISRGRGSRITIGSRSISRACPAACSSRAGRLGPRKPEAKGNAWTDCFELAWRPFWLPWRADARPGTRRAS